MKFGQLLRTLGRCQGKYVAPHSPYKEGELRRQLALRTKAVRRDIDVDIMKICRDNDV